ncbi:LytR/AlgR family response regulator transcription factor [Desulforhopalus singaporensis]|uniref:Two component transcriptional regulator, LytTR family n=1 Tax=Desulforhopalus singaporensis TaxID=91360 RepID=A0A1H0KTU3_9BACT|nr:LytTR family DNA-binding domain-containing protein [Desulforhopalus singaporensis]SDO59359.1 two component transcriptional regulator, LytTR family [Desulforhopalus singaporensis]
MVVSHAKRKTPAPIRCLIVDDEQPARDELRYLLLQHDDIDIVAEADSAGKAVEAIRRYKPDLVFLDIQLPGRNGFEVIRELAGVTNMPLFVFATAYDSYAVKAFEESAVDYIMKPLSEKRLAITLQRVRKMVADSSSGREELGSALQALLNQIESPRERIKVSVEKNGRIQLLTPEEIVYCSYETTGIVVHTRDDSSPIYGISTMDRLEEHLCSLSFFFRAHRSVLVNLDHIKEFSPWFNGKYNLTMDDAKMSEITVSRTRAKAFKQRLGI